MHRPASRSRRWSVTATGLALTAVAATVSGCSSDDGPGARYVAIGDSVAAGSGVSASTTDCQRSDHNYPTLVAESLGISTLDDQTCGGATTRTVLDGRDTAGLTALDPQIDAVGRATELVTVTLGANDADVAPLYFQSCLIPPANTAAACSTVLSDATKALATTRTDLTTTLKNIVKRAPDARVFVIGYPRLAPDADAVPCQSLAVPTAEAAGAVALEQAIEDTLRAAARAANVEFVSVRKGSAAHGPCSSEPWVNGVAPQPGDGVLLHPTARGVEVIADRVSAAIRAHEQ